MHGFNFVSFCKLEGCRVHAVTQARRRRPVVEQMAQVGTASRAENFRPHHEEGPVRGGSDILRGNRSGKTGPPSARIKFGA